MMKKAREVSHTEKINFAELALLEDELHTLEEQNGTEQPLKLWQRAGDWYFEHRENRQKHLVNRKTYLLLTLFLGWAGGHRFYEKRRGLGLFYLALCWSGFPIALAVVDLMIALPMKADENGCIMI